MDFSFHAVRFSSCFSKRWSIAQAIPFSFVNATSHLIGLPSAVLVLGLVFDQAAFAVGDPIKGAANWDYLCNHCHGAPQPNNPAAFRAYGTTANPLSLYANNPSAITRATNAGYTIPNGNTNDDYEAGTSTAIPMGSFAGMGEKRMGVGEVPTQYAIDISAYLASYFAVPGAPVIGSVQAGNSQATVSFAAPKSELAITTYTVTANPGGLSATGSASPITVQGLSNGAAYTFSVTATSNAGTGKPSSASNAVIPGATTQTAAVVSVPAIAAVAKPTLSVSGSSDNAPATIQSAQTKNIAASPSSLSAPTIVAAKPGSTEVRVYFTVPQDSAALISGYTVVAYSGGVATAMKATGTNSPITVKGLTNGTDYIFFVIANSKSGTRVTSDASNIVTPLSILGN